MKRLAFLAFVSLLVLPGLIAVVPLAASVGSDDSAAVHTLHPTRVIQGVHDESGPLADAVGVPAERAEEAYEAEQEREGEAGNRPTEGEGEGEGEGFPHNLFEGRNTVSSPDAGLQTNLPAGQIPAPLVNFRALDNRRNPDGPTNIRPPDTNADVGPNHIVEVVNQSIGVFDKQGRLAPGFPKAINALFAGFDAGPVCRDTNDGDPVVVYDQLADRWLVSQFAFPAFPNPPYFQCIAVSKTGDPRGAWYRYQFDYPVDRLNDYPKFGVWPDAYYASFNEFTPPNFSFAGSGVIAYDRRNMLQGRDASMVYVSVGEIDPNTGGMLPSDLNGSTLPPAGAPNYFVDMEYDDFGFHSDRLQLWKFHVDFQNPNQSTFTGPTVLYPERFGNPLCNFRTCVPQPGTPEKLDTLSDRIMYRLNYRNLGTRESLVFTQSIDVGDQRAGIRWYEVSGPSTVPAIRQAGTFGPDDGLHRWMGSANMDKNGNIAIGYSVSSTSTFPSIRYVGRMASDPPGELTLGEGSIVEGEGSQTSPEGRWGDYSSMSVDPVDDCTFWYSQEYMRTPGLSFANWATRIASFKLPGCE